MKTVTTNASTESLSPVPDTTTHLHPIWSCSRCKSQQSVCWDFFKFFIWNFVHFKKAFWFFKSIWQYLYMFYSSLIHMGNVYKWKKSISIKKNLNNPKNQFFVWFLLTLCPILKHIYNVLILPISLITFRNRFVAFRFPGNLSISSFSFNPCFTRFSCWVETVEWLNTSLKLLMRCVQWFWAKFMTIQMMIENCII